MGDRRIAWESSSDFTAMIRFLNHYVDLTAPLENMCSRARNNPRLLREADEVLELLRALRALK